MNRWWRSGAGVALLAAALAVLAYSNALHGKFVFDDQLEIVENASIADLGNVKQVLTGHGLTRPVVNLTYAIDYAWNGGKEFGFHLTNLMLHVVNVLLLFLVVHRLVAEAGRLGGREIERRVLNGTAFAAAALLAVHPLMTEAVSYISGRAEVLATTFFLTSFYCFRRGFIDGPAWSAAGAVSLVLGAASKETVAVFPFVLVVSDLLVPPTPGVRRRVVRVHAPLIALIVAGGVARIGYHLFVEYRGAASVITLQGVALQAHIVSRYLGLLVWPSGQTVVQPVPPTVSLDDPRFLLAAIVIGGLSAGAFSLRRAVPLVTLGVAWFFLALLPSSALTLLTPFGQSMSEHRTYLPSIGLFMAGAALVVRLTGFDRSPRPARDRLVGGMLAAVLAVLVALTMARNRVWADPLLVWQEAVDRAPQTMFGHLKLGETYRAMGDCAAAREAFQRAIDLDPGRSAGYLGLAGCQLQARRIDDARRTLLAALEHAPGDSRARVALAAIEEFTFRRPAEAARLCREAMALEPGLVDAQECFQRNQSKLQFLPR
jgi:protein O-mannosyl-transferase